VFGHPEEFTEPDCFLLICCFKVVAESQRDGTFLILYWKTDLPHWRESAWMKRYLRALPH
jgi:hypothetical protein